MASVRIVRTATRGARMSAGRKLLALLNNA